MLQLCCNYAATCRPRLCCAYHGTTYYIPGSYGRVLRLSPEGLATLTADMTPRLTNLWKLSEIAEVAPDPLA